MLSLFLIFSSNKELEVELYQGDNPVMYELVKENGNHFDGTESFCNNMRLKYSAGEFLIMCDSGTDRTYPAEISYVDDELDKMNETVEDELDKIYYDLWSLLCALADLENETYYNFTLSQLATNENKIEILKLQIKDALPLAKYKDYIHTNRIAVAGLVIAVICLVLLIAVIGRMALSSPEQHDEGVYEPPA